MKVYYAHSMHLYGKPQEARDLNLLRGMGFDIVNPAEKKYTQMCQDIKDTCSDKQVASELIMEAFVEVVKSCDLLAFRAHPDGKIPSGVGKEVKAALDAGIPVIELPTLVESRFMTIKETRQYLELLGER